MQAVSGAEKPPRAVAKMVLPQLLPTCGGPGCAQLVEQFNLQLNYMKAGVLER